MAFHPQDTSSQCLVKSEIARSYCNCRQCFAHLLRSYCRCADVACDVNNQCNAVDWYAARFHSRVQIVEMQSPVINKLCA